MIGVLDIFGFEIFQDAKTKLHQNSLEQLCINFANESLQQDFNKNMLQSEQEEYQEEEIPWNHITFPDNKSIIDLIGDPQKGVFRYLNDEALFPKGDDKGFLKKVASLNGNKEAFSKDSCLVTIQNIVQYQEFDPEVRTVHR